MEKWKKALAIAKIILMAVPTFLASFFAFGGSKTKELEMAQNLAPVAVAMIQSVESVMGDGTGVQKKAAVVAGLTAFTGAMAEYSTGAQKETWEGIKSGDMGGVVDAIVGTVNAVKDVPDAVGTDGFAV